jgi:hypothetical protein
MGTLWLAELFGLTPDWAAVWASVEADTSKGAKAATLISIAKRFILLSPFYSLRPPLSTAATHVNRNSFKPSKRGVGRAARPTSGS